ncbi:hypothetical protein M426DRAFT_263266 [Hypoxylon sp. CI-4A]|nr:hypothetical protein M426DRAFT_263266 [Hypoxylon sp. CI-4A]
MGLKKFSLKERAVGQIRSISEWSSEHYERHRRPLRIAVDQANWWFRNVPPEKERKIQKELIFVFDGPNKPWKHRLHGQTYKEENVALLKELLDQMGVPRHEAPGEAEAECVRLQQLGVVDTVWSDDTDTFMFGCTSLVQFHKPEGSEFNSKDDVLFYTIDDITSRSKLSREGLVMHAILVGCDYSDGLGNFGVSTLLDLAKHPKFQETAEILFRSVSNEYRELGKWRAMLFNMVKDIFPGRQFTMPPNTFPSHDIIASCCRPRVSSDNKLKSLDGDWFRPFGPNLRERCIFLRNYFHSRKRKDWPTEYLVPIELNYRLRERAAGRQVAVFNFDVTEKVLGASCKATFTVNPILVIPEFLDVYPPEHEFSMVEVTLLDCVVSQGMPQLTEKASTKGKRGRPRKTTSTGETATPASRPERKPTTAPKLTTGAPSRSVGSRKRGSNALTDISNITTPRSNPMPEKGSATQAGPSNKAVMNKNKGTSFRVPRITPNPENDENNVPNEDLGSTSTKRRKVEAPSYGDVIDLTGSD